MSLLLFAVIALVALQFTSAIGQWISENQKATQTVAWMQWFVTKFGLAPTIITTRVVIIAAVVVAYELQQHWLVWAVLAASAWYLYKTAAYVTIWAKLKSEAESVVTGEITNVVTNAVTDVTKVAMVDPKEAQASVTLAQHQGNQCVNPGNTAAAMGVDVSKIGK